MKYLLIFLILTSCGKHTAPAEKDLRDSDGDGSSNEYDADKYKAEVITVEEVSADMEFEIGQSKLTKYKFSLSNNIDLQFFSKDLMVKSSLAITESDFFSEFSILKIKSHNSNSPVLNGSTRVQINFSKVQTAPRSLLFVTKSKRIRLGDWKETMELELSQSDLESILKGEAFFSLSHMDKQISLHNQTQEERIKEKNYRVVYNDGKTTKIHYISKELSLDKILEKLNVSSFKFIEEQNLLTTTIKPINPEWWVRQNQNDIIIIKDNLRDLSDHYLKGFNKKLENVTRKNGYAPNSLLIKRTASSRVLLKVRTQQKQSSFVETRRDNRVRVGGQDHDAYGCVEHTRTASPEFSTNFSYIDFLDTFLVNGLDLNEHKNVAVRYLTDEIGDFWEIEFSGAEELNISLTNLAANNYIQVGLFKSVSCIGDTRGGEYNNNLQSSERSLNFQIEAFVENI